MPGRGRGKGSRGRPKKTATRPASLNVNAVFTAGAATADGVGSSGGSSRSGTPGTGTFAGVTSADAGTGGDDNKRKYEYPPIFDSKKVSFDQWKLLVDDWTHMTSTPPELQGMAIRMSLRDEALQAAMHVSTADIRSANGVKLLLEELDRIYIPDAMIRKVLILHEVYNLVRPADRSVCDFINDFSDVYLKVTQIGHSIDEENLAYLLLRSCNLDIGKIQLVMSTFTKTGLTFQNMKDSLNKIFAAEVLVKQTPNRANGFGSDSDILLNTRDIEDNDENTVFYSNNRQDGSPRAGASGRNNHYSRDRSPRRNSGRYDSRYSSPRPYSANDRARNPLKNGVPLTCFRCKSTDHFIRNCPDENSDRSRERDRNSRERDRNSRDRDRNSRDRDRNSRSNEVSFTY